MRLRVSLKWTIFQGFLGELPRKPLPRRSMNRIGWVTTSFEGCSLQEKALALGVPTKRPSLLLFFLCRFPRSVSRTLGRALPYHSTTLPFNNASYLLQYLLEGGTDVLQSSLEQRVHRIPLLQAPAFNASRPRKAGRRQPDELTSSYVSALQTSSLVLTCRITSSVNSVVPTDPPRSTVRLPSSTDSRVDS